MTTLPVGSTLRGAWELSFPAGSSGGDGEGQSFVFTLASAPTSHVIPSAGSNPDPTDCPGTATNPQAASGQFCLYESGINNLSGLEPCDPTEGTCVPISRFGFFIGANVTNTSLASYAAGTWAVTG